MTSGSGFDSAKALPRVPFSNVFSDVSAGSKKTMQADYLKSGSIPVIDQGSKGVAGYTNDSQAMCPVELPVVLFGDHTRRFKFVDHPFAVGADGVKILKARSTLDTRYGFHYLSSLDLPSAGYSRHFKFLKEVSVPLPPLAEQRRIALILDRADELRAMRRRALNHCEELADSIFFDMFGDVSGSVARPLGEVALFFAGASLPAGQTFAGQSEGALHLKVSDMNARGNERNISTSLLWSRGFGARAATAPAGSVVIPKRGGAIATNKKRVLTRTAVLDPNLMAIAPKPEFLHSEYLFAWFQQLDLSTLSSGSSVPQLNKQDLLPIMIDVPAMSVQLEFAERIADLERLVDAISASVRHLDELFVSLQHRAFLGQL